MKYKIILYDTVHSVLYDGLSIGHNQMVQYAQLVQYPVSYSKWCGTVWGQPLRQDRCGTIIVYHVILYWSPTCLLVVTRARAAALMTRSGLGMIVPVTFGCDPGTASLAPEPSFAEPPGNQFVSVRVTSGPAVEARIFTASTADTPPVVSRSSSPLPSSWSHLAAEVVTVQSAFDEDQLWRTWVVVVHHDPDLPAAWAGMFVGASTGVELVGVACFNCQNLNFSTKGGSNAIKRIGACVLDGPIFALAGAGKVVYLKLGNPTAGLLGIFDRYREVDDVVICRSNRIRRKRTCVYILARTFSEKTSVPPHHHTLWQVDLATQLDKYIGPLRVFQSSKEARTEQNPPLAEEVGSFCISSDPFADVIVVAWRSGRISYVCASSGHCIRQCEALPSLARGFSQLQLAPDYRRVVCCTSKVSDSSNRPLSFSDEAWVIQMPDNHERCLIHPLFNKLDISPTQSVHTLLVDLVSESLVPTGFGSRQFFGRSSGLTEFSSRSSEEGSEIVVEVGQWPWPMKKGDSRDEFSNVLTRLESRLRMGLVALVAANVTLDEKKHIVEHARKLLAHIAESRPAPSVSDIFVTSLTSLLDGDPSMRLPSILKPVKEATVGNRLLAPNAAKTIRPVFSQEGNELLRVIRAGHFVDQCGVNLVVVVEGIVGEQEITAGPQRMGQDRISGGDHSNASAAKVLWLDVQIGGATALIWESVDIAVTKQSRKCLSSRTSIAELVPHLSAGLTEMSADIRVLSSDGHSQSLGTFEIAPEVLMNILPGGPNRAPSWCSSWVKPFTTSINLVARGSGAAALPLAKRSSSRRRFPDVADFLCSEDAAMFSVPAYSSTSVAILAADLQARAPEGLDLGAACITCDRVEAFDRASDGILRELRQTRAYSKACGKSHFLNVANIFLAQAEAEDRLGKLEEIHAIASEQI